MHIHTYTHRHMDTSILRYIHTRLWHTYTSIHRSIPPSLHPSIHPPVHVCMHASIPTYLPTYLPTYIHIHLCAYAYVCLYLPTGSTVVPIFVALEAYKVIPKKELLWSLWVCTQSQLGPGPLHRWRLAAATCGGPNPFQKSLGPSGLGFRG